MRSTNKYIEQKNPQSIKPQLFNFKINSKTAKHTNNNSFTKSFSVKLKYDNDLQYSDSHQLQWKPKIPTKKLFQQPRFLLSIQRKKIRVINGIKDTDIHEQSQNNNIRKEYPIKRHYKNSTKRLSEHIKQQQQNKDPYSHTQFYSVKSISQNNKKIPIVNFNLQHIIQKRKTFKSQHNSRKNKKGSNTPIYSYISSERFKRSKKNIDLPFDFSLNGFQRPITNINSRINSIEWDKNMYESSKTEYFNTFKKQ